MQTPRGERGRERERAAHCGWGSFRGENIPPRMALCVYIMRFNWIVLHQCQEVSRCVCRGLCSFPTASQYLAWNKVLLRFQSQTISERSTSRQTGNIHMPPGLVLKVPKLHNNNSSNGSAGYFWTQAMHDSSAQLRVFFGRCALLSVKMGPEKHLWIDNENY